MANNHQTDFIMGEREGRDPAMGACHWERAEVLQRVHRVKQKLDETLRQRPADRPAIEQLRRELLRASEALAALPDCSE